MEGCPDCLRVELLGKVNKLGKELYGNALNSLSNETLQSVVENNRGSGKTTATALAYISQAILNPNVTIRLVSDHRDTQLMNNQMREQVQELVTKLDFKYLVIRPLHNTITYKI